MQSSCRGRVVQARRRKLLKTEGEQDDRDPSRGSKHAHAVQCPKGDRCGVYTCHGEERHVCAERRAQTSIRSHASLCCQWGQYQNIQGHIQTPSLHFSLVITSISPATHIYHAGASLSPTKLVSPDAVARLVGANPANSSSPHPKGLGFNPQQDLERQKEMI